MKEKSFIDLYFSSKPWIRKIIDFGEWIILIAVGVFFPNPKFSTFIGIKIFGGILIILGIYVHKCAHSVNKEAHLPKERINTIVTTGIYAKIRHPCYAAYLYSYLGTFFIIGSLSMLFPLILFSYLFYDSAIKEEKFLIKKFGRKYEEYIKKVPWKFIPKIF